MCLYEVVILLQKLHLFVILFSHVSTNNPIIDVQINNVLRGFKSASIGPTHRGFVGVDRNVVHLIEVVVQETLLRMRLNNLAQCFPAQLLRGQSWRLTIYPIGRPEEEEKDVYIAVEQGSFHNSS